MTPDQLWPRGPSAGFLPSLTTPRAMHGERLTFRESCSTPWVHQTMLDCFPTSRWSRRNLGLTSNRVAVSLDTMPSCPTVAMHRSHQVSIRRWLFGAFLRLTLQSPHRIEHMRSTISCLFRTLMEASI